MSYDNDETAAKASVPVAAPYDLRHGITCAAVSVCVGVTQSLTAYGVNNNLDSLQGELGATAADISWLATAYFSTTLSAIVLLTKARLQFGLRRFAIGSIGLFVLISAAHLLLHDLRSAIAVRAALGFAAPPLITLAVLYMMEAMPPRVAPLGLALGFATVQFGSPLGRIVAEPLFDAMPGLGMSVFDVALALVSLAAILAVTLREPPPQKVFNAGDLHCFVLYAVGLALLCAVVTQGRLRWWTDTPWIGACLAGAVLCIGAYVFIELRRERPMIDLRWVVSPPVWRFVVAALLFRIVLSEQTSGAVGLLNALGLTNDQMHHLFVWVCIGTALGFAAVVLALVRQQIRLPFFVSLLLIVIASLLDALSSPLTRPQELLVSQTLIGIATGMFLGTALVYGLMPIVRDGMRNLVGFLGMFTLANNLGSLIGAALLGSYVFEQQKLHYSHLLESLTLTDPQVVARVAELAGAQAGALVDPEQRIATGIATLAQQTSLQAWVLAYDDLFRGVACIAALTFAWLAGARLISRRRERKAHRAPVPG